MLSILKAGAPAPAPAFSPSSLSPILWLDAQTANTLATTGGSVDSWASRAAGGSAVGTTTRRPTLNTTAFGAGKPGVVFTAPSNRLVLSSFTALDGATAFTIAMVMKSPSLDVNAAVFGPAEANAVGVELVEDGSNRQWYRVDGVAIDNGNVLPSLTESPVSPPTPPRPALWSTGNVAAVSVLSFKASSAPLVGDGLIAARLNSQEVRSKVVTSGVVGATTYALGSYADNALGPNGGKNMTMGEFIIIGRVLTTNERQSLETYLTSRWL